MFTFSEYDNGLIEEIKENLPRLSEQDLSNIRIPETYYQVLRKMVDPTDKNKIAWLTAGGFSTFDYEESIEKQKRIIDVLKKTFNEGSELRVFQFKIKELKGKSLKKFLDEIVY